MSRHQEPVTFECSCADGTFMKVYANTLGHCVNCGTFYRMDFDDSLVVEFRSPAGPQDSYAKNIDWPA